MTVNLKTAFWPAHRASPDDFWLGLGVIALIDAVRLSIAPSGVALILWLAILFFVAAVHINRLRDARRRPGLALVPLGLASAAKFFGAAVGVAAGVFPIFIRYMETQGVDVDDPAALQAAAQDPAIGEGFQTYIAGDAQAMAIITSAGDWPSMIAFWAVIFALGFWFASIKPRPAP